MNRHHFRSVAWAVLIAVAGLLVTGYLTRRALFNATAEAKEEFDAGCREIQAKIGVRMAAHEQILRSSAAFFADEDGITRSEFRDYAARQKMNQTLPGIQGLGFALLVPRSEVEQHLQTVRAEGFPTYRIWPEGERETYTSIVFLEPFAGRNLRAFGYDMFTEPVRRAAMERSRDLDEIALSGKVELVQEDGHDVQAGTLMYAPVYRREPAPMTVAARRAAFLGWIYSPYRMGDLMSAGIPGPWDLTARRKIRLEIFDGETATPAALLYASQPQGAPVPARAALPTNDAVVEYAGRHWLLRFTAAGGTGALVDHHWAWLLFGSGVLTSLLLAGLAFSLASTQASARRQAVRLTADLRQSEHLYRELFELSADALLLLALDTGRIIDANRMAELLYGYERDELLTKVATDLSAEPEETSRRTHEAQSKPGQVFNIPLRLHRKRDGTVFPVEITARSLLVDGQSVLLMASHDITARQQAEAQMRWNNALLEAHLDTTTDGILIVDKTGQKIMQNRQCVELLKIPKDLADSQDDSPQFNFVRDRTKNTDQFVERVRYLYSHPNETSRDEVEFKDGMILDRYSAPVIAKDGTNLGRIWAFRDVTARKRTEEEQHQSRRAAFNLMTDAIEARVRLEQASQVLRASEEKYRTLVENLSSGIVIHRPDSSILFANTAAEAMLGLSTDHLLGKTAMELRWQFLEEDGSTIPIETYPVMRVIATGKGFRGQILGICRPDLTAPVWVLCNGYPEQNEDGQLKQVVITFSDITARRQAEEALRHSEERLQLVMRGSQLGYWDWNLETGQVVRNARWAEMLGYDLHELEFTVKQWADFIHPDDVAQAERSIRDHVEGRTPMHRMEYRMQMKDGTYKWILDQAQVVKRDAAGRAMRMSGTHTDVTERKQAELEIRRLNQTLEERVVERTADLAAANAELEAFSYSVSHDLRAPLRAMDGFSAALLEDCAGKLDETAQDHLRRIRAGSQRMGTLIDDLLNLSRESRAAMRRERVDLTALINGICADLSAVRSDHCPEWAVAPAMVAQADARMLRVVLRNLLGNAWKFTSQRAGARIEVGVLSPEEARLTAPPELLVPGAEVFFVRDNGAGFDMAYADRLFGAFQRLHSQREFEGTGIGLALVKRIIRRHGGFIWATGKVNEGATFYFTLGKNESEPHEP